MTCILKWAASRTGLTTQQYALLVALANIAVDGRATGKKAEIGAHVGLKERQTHTVLEQLAALALIKKERHGGAGKGRVANSYLLNPPPEATGNVAQEAQQAKSSNMQPSAGIAAPALERIEQSAAGTGLQSAPPKKSPYENNSYPLELGSEPLVLEGEVVVVAANSDRPPPPAWQRVVDAIGSSFLDPNRNLRLVHEGAMVQGWLDAGADEHLDVIPTVRRLLEAKREPVPWKFFEKAVREATARRLAAAQRQAPITAQEARAHDNFAGQSRSGQAANDRRGQPRRSKLDDLLSQEFGGDFLAE